MTDEQRSGLLFESWLKDTDPTPPDARPSVARVMANVPRTRQRGRWLPFPVLYRKARTATATDTPDERPSPIPAISGHAPTVIGRTQTMFSPAKAVTVGALVFALGGAFLIAQPFEQPGNVPGAEQGAEPPVRVEVTEALGLGECEDPTDGSADFVCEVLHEWSDPRLQGTSLTLENSRSIEVPDADGGELGIINDIYNIETEDGTWRMRPQLRFEFEGWPELEEGPWWWVLDGDGAYEGLSLLLIRDRREGGREPLHGFMISTDLLPPAPEGASTK